MKTASVNVGRCTLAQVRAGNRNGALHGVAMTVVKTPLKNAPAAPSWAARSAVLPRPTKPGIGTSQTPRKLSPITKTTAARVIVKAADAELLPPAQLLRGDGQRGQHDKHGHQAGRIPEIEHQRLAAIMPRLLQEGQQSSARSPAARRA